MATEESITHIACWREMKSCCVKRIECGLCACVMGKHELRVNPSDDSENESLCDYWFYLLSIDASIFVVHYSVYSTTKNAKTIVYYARGSIGRSLS